MRATDQQTRYVGVPAMNAIARHLAESLEVITQTSVTSVVPGQKGWILNDAANRELGCFDALIVAMPAAQAAELLARSPKLAEPIRACRLSPCWAVMAAFDQQVELPFDGAFVHDSPLGWIARNSSKPDRPPSECWVLHASPAWSTVHLEDEPVSVCNSLLAAFRQATGRKNLRPIHVAAHRWRYALPSPPLNAGCITDDASRVVVCGDWCHGARIEGAFVSGLTAAERVEDLLGIASEVHEGGNS
jgi:predicted NAD/FAD-dependent oxidoreductase